MFRFARTTMSHEKLARITGVVLFVLPIVLAACNSDGGGGGGGGTGY